MFVIVVGTMFGPKTIHGPFEDAEHANQWASINVGKQPYEIIPLNKGANKCHKKT
jgi:hypothetical protein